VKKRRLPPVYHQPKPVQEVDCRRLADLCLRHQSGDYYEAAERLADHLKLPPQARLKLKRCIGTYVRER
jgi:hypothetical protein